MPYSRRCLITFFAIMLASTLTACAVPVKAEAGQTVCESWSTWTAFKQDFLQPDGRVIDVSAGGYTTSEGQAYALFFALIANDRTAFDTILSWTRNNLTGGDMTARLMAWKWGERTDHSWGVIDEHAASDADLWMAYTLSQAGQVWHDENLSAQAELIQARIAKELVVYIEGVGPVLLPGPLGFSLSSGSYKLNPSYLPMPVLRGLAEQYTEGPWQGLFETTLKMIETTTPAKLAADWVAVKPKLGFAVQEGNQGGYEAVRVYLWVGLMSAKDPKRALLLKQLTGMHEVIKRDLLPPERIDVVSGKVSGVGPAGFSAAMLPILTAWGDMRAVRLQQARIVAMGGLPKHYYEQALGLFSQGWMEQRYRFEPNGKLVVKKVAKCTK